MKYEEWLGTVVSSAFWYKQIKLNWAPAGRLKWRNPYRYSDTAGGDLLVLTFIQNNNKN